MFFGSDIIILGLSSLRYDKNIFVISWYILIVFFFFSKMIFEICLSEYEYMSGK